MARILILSNNELGLYKFRKELIQELIINGNDVYISLPTGEMVSYLEDLGAIMIDTPVDRRGTNLFLDLKLILSYVRILDQVKPDLIITYTIKPNIYGGIISRIKNIPYVINITGLGTAFQRNGLFKRIIITLYKLTCAKAKSVLFENEENLSIFVDHKILNKERAYKLNGAGVNLEEYPFTEYPSESDLNFLFIGRIMKEKGIDELFRMVREIKKQYNHVTFHILGRLEENYKEIILQLEEEGLICYYGYQEDVIPFIKKSHCVILPSYHEGMANTLLEAAAMGRPLITSRIHGCMEAVIDGESGYLVTLKDADDLYQKVNRFISVNHVDKVKMGRKSRDHIERIFDKKEVVKSTLEAIRI